jgi:hypothetical protein
MVDADAHPTRVGGKIVDAIGHSTTEVGDDKIVHANFLRLALRPPFAASVLEVADQFLLLGVDRDRRLPCRQRFLHPIVDVVELRIAIGMLPALARLAVGLQAIAKLVQQFAHDGSTDVMTHVAQPARQLAQALAGPQKRRLRIAARLRFDQRTQIIQKARIRLAQRLAPSAQPACPPRFRPLIGPQFGQSAADRAARNARGACDRTDPAIPGRRRFGRRKPPKPTLIEHRSKRRKAPAYR